MTHNTVIAERRCKYCGKYFTPTRNTARYCSQLCLELYHRELQKQKRIKQGRQPVKTTRCVVCNKRFEKKSPTHILCSTECATIRRKAQYADRLAVNKSDRNYIECNRCGNIFKSWDRTKNRRCARCQYEIEEQSIGVDVHLLELGR